MERQHQGMDKPVDDGQSSQWMHLSETPNDVWASLVILSQQKQNRTANKCSNFRIKTLSIWLKIGKNCIECTLSQAMSVLRRFLTTRSLAPECSLIWSYPRPCKSNYSCVNNNNNNNNTRNETLLTVAYLLRVSMQNFKHLFRLLTASKVL